MFHDRAGRVGFAPGWLFFSFLATLAILKGLRMPNRWAATHYLFNYQTGFMKRALWGETLSRVLGAWTAKYFVLAAVGLSVFALFIVLLIVACRRVPDVSSRVPFLLVLLASPALTFSAHLVGYLEQLAYLGVLIVIVQRRSWALQCACAMAVAILLPAVHEASAFWVGALSVLAVVSGPAARDRSTARRLVAGALVTLLWGVSTLAVINNGKVTPARAEVIREERTAFADTRPRQDAFQTLTVPLAVSLADMRVRWADPNTRIAMVFSLMVFAPTAIFLGAIAWRRARVLQASRSVRTLTNLLIVASIASPLLMHIVGWDQHRWNSMVALNAGLAALILLTTATAPDGGAIESPRVPTRRLASLAIALCLWNLSADPVLFDAYGPAHPPFEYQFQFLKEAIETRDPSIWIPRPGN